MKENKCEVPWKRSKIKIAYLRAYFKDWWGGHDILERSKKRALKRKEEHDGEINNKDSY